MHHCQIPALSAIDLPPRAFRHGAISRPKARRWRMKTLDQFNDSLVRIEVMPDEKITSAEIERLTGLSNVGFDIPIEEGQLFCWPWGQWNGDRDQTTGRIRHSILFIVSDRKVREMMWGEEGSFSGASARMLVG